MDEMEELLGEFLNECQDVLARVRERLENYIHSDQKSQDLDDIARGVHTIKGGTGMFEMNDIMEKTHKLETYLVKFKKRPEALQGDHLKSVQRYIDHIEELLFATQKLQQVSAESPASDVPSETASSSVVQEIKADHKTNAGHEVVRVPVDRIQRNLDIVSELFLIRNKMAYMVEKNISDFQGKDSFLTEWEALDNTLRKRIGELEHIAMGMRMMPIKNLFQRMTKTVDVYCEQSGKDIDIHVFGEMTELDKKVLDYLAEPLIHLIRNAMDHGIESHDARVSAGKPRKGSIFLRSEVRGNEVVIQIEDDGKGIDPKAIVESARRKGFDVSRVQNDQQAIDLIFAPGFSTAEEVSEISGRGVGMDAVRNFVESIGGNIVVDSKVGRGTRFSLHLPLGMSLIQAILVEINGEQYAIATSDVQETRCIKEDQSVQHGEEMFVPFGEKLIPCVFIKDYFRNDDMFPLQIKAKELHACVIRDGSQTVAICVDRFIQNTEIAVKPLPSIVPRLPYVAGCSLLMTGQPILLLSPQRLYQWVREELQKRREHAA